MPTSFGDAVLSGDLSLFKSCLEAGVDHSSIDFFSRTPIFGLRYCRDASVNGFVDVIRMFMAAGADVNHVDVFGNTLLMMSEVDNLGVALVSVGAKTSYDWNGYSKLALTNAAVYGCTRTIDAVVNSRRGLADQVQQNELDSCLDNASKILSYNPNLVVMSGIVKLIVDYGADPNKWRTLHECVRSNHVLVSTLVSLGARPDVLAWDFGRGVKNTPFHRVGDMTTFEVFDSLFRPGTDVDIRDISGATPLMSLLKFSSYVHSNEAIVTKLNWLIYRGASCLPFDNNGKRASQMPQSGEPFKSLIASRVKEENWLKRRGIVLMRTRTRSWVRRSKRLMTLEEEVARLNIDGVFRLIVCFI